MRKNNINKKDSYKNIALSIKEVKNILNSLNKDYVRNIAIKRVKKLQKKDTNYSFIDLLENSYIDIFIEVVDDIIYDKQPNSFKKDGPNSYCDENSYDDAYAEWEEAYNNKCFELSKKLALEMVIGIKL